MSDSSEDLTPPFGEEEVRRAQPPLAAGGVFSVVGPDGVGKTTLIDAVLGETLSGLSVMNIRRVGVLWRRTIPNVPVTEPHKDPPYSTALSLLKVAYLYADYLLGWWLRVRPFVRRGGVVLLQRGWWDQAVDPLRYRLRFPAPVLWQLGRLLPKPDFLLILEAPPEIVYARKTELSLDELTRQQNAWRTNLPRGQKRAYLDASRPAPEVLAQAEEEMERLVQDSPKLSVGSGWASLPRNDRPRFRLPTRPRVAAAAGVSVYHPMTSKGRAGWEVARVLAKLGLARLLPSKPLPRGLTEAVARYVPEGGTVAVAATNHPGRHIVLLLDREGVACGVAKVVTSEQGKRALVREARALEAYRGRLSSPLSAPSVLAQGDGVLLFQAVQWRARFLPWRLPAEVAGAVGRFWAQGGGGDEGLSHGDFAPWNLYRTQTGWALLDWEEAQEHGPAFFDFWHYLVQGHALLGRPSARALLSGLDGKGWVGAALRAYVAGAGLSEKDARNGLMHYLETSAQGLDASVADQARGLEARGRLLQKMAI